MTVIMVMVMILIYFLGRLVTHLFVKEAEGRFDGIPGLILRLARRCVPPELRVPIYDEEWLPELLHIQAEHKDRPITRLVLGVRYSAGLLLAARRVAIAAGAPGALARLRQRIADSRLAAAMFEIGMAMLTVVALGVFLLVLAALGRALINGNLPEWLLTVWHMLSAGIWVTAVLARPVARRIKKAALTR